MAKLQPDQLQTLLADAWFSTLPEAVREDILSVAILRHLNEGAPVYRKGDCANGWFGLLEGAVRMGWTSHEGKEVVLTFMERGAWFGEVALLDGLSRTNDAIAHSDTTLLMVTSGDFHALLKRHPVLYSHFTALYCQRMRMMYLLSEESSMLPMEARLARRLLNLAVQYGLTQEHGIEIDLHLTQESVARLLGASRQRVNQTLKAWERKGWVQTRQAKIVVCTGLARAFPRAIY